MARYKIRREGGVFDITPSGQPVIVYPKKSSTGWNQYLDWCKAGNAPDPADPVPPPAPPPPSGAARRRRQFDKLAATDPVAALVKERYRVHKNSL